MTASITIVDYNPAWPELYKRERETLLAAIGDHVEAVEHIGSTAVPGLGAKPVIDIMIGVDTLAEADAYCVEPIIKLGYEYVKESVAELGLSGVRPAFGPVFSV